MNYNDIQEIWGIYELTEAGYSGAVTNEQIDIYHKVVSEFDPPSFDIDQAKAILSKLPAYDLGNESENIKQAVADYWFHLACKQNKCSYLTENFSVSLLKY